MKGTAPSLPSREAAHEGDAGTCDRDARIAASGCAWRLLPKCFPPASTVRRYFYACHDAGLFDAITIASVMGLREFTESGGVRGYDAGKNIKGRKRHLLADDGYAEQKVRDAITCHRNWIIKIIKRSDAAKSFGILARRWVVERTFAWLGRCRRLAEDWDTPLSSLTVWALVASISMITRRSATYCCA